jgi:hypothetical protein
MPIARHADAIDGLYRELIGRRRAVTSGTLGSSP